MLLDAARDGAWVSGGRCWASAPSLGGHPGGRELQVLSSDGRLALQIRIYLANKRQYQVVSVTPKERDRRRTKTGFRLLQADGE